MLIARAVSGFSTRIKLYINSCKFLKNVPLRGPLTFDRSSNMVRRSTCNVVFTGMYARRKEFDIMKSIGMTDKQMKLMLFAEGSYYFMCDGNVVYCRGDSLGWRDNLYGKSEVIVSEKCSEKQIRMIT